MSSCNNFVLFLYYRHLSIFWKIFAITFSTLTLILVLMAPTRFGVVGVNGYLSADDGL
jgi:hypothetical protein